ncbi:MAG: (Fe-S)-binding protein [Fuerstiella sp.]|jgi:L-lactate dehydrogenase complex protein LldE|nr:(Fe-S)-binding protein [Fuerstiella sp.]MCP4513503.1 (Fe-S)-binding protein [Fuerstiella sp.]MDG2131257.1 (Fe-S)-binding protein [Fuerstiella sp.]
MKVALFIPCYVDQFYPQVGMSTVRLLEHFGVEHEFPEAQTCCGQPMANSGCMPEAKPLAEKFVEVFDGYDYVVAPSGSCVSMVRNHYESFFDETDLRANTVRSRTLELSEFLVNVLKVERIEGRFDHQVGLHQSCHGLRELRLSASSEAMTERPGMTKDLLSGLAGISFSQLKREDECCGFGGTFAVAEEAVSCMMGEDRIQDHLEAGTNVLTAGDMSCLMHLDGIIRRRKHDMRVMHFAEILAEAIACVGTPNNL